MDDEYRHDTMPPSAAKMIQDYARVNETGEPDHYIKTFNHPVAVHVFNRHVVIVGNDSTVVSLMRR